MPVDYSKWDKLELSDDSDIEVHPNVDKRSFIRAKQAQIHQQRAQRKHQIDTLQYERIINDGLLIRIDRLLTALKSHKPEAANADELVLQSLIESAGDPAADRPPPPPAGVHANTQEQPVYSKMMAALVDQVKKEVDEKSPSNRLEGFISGVTGHKTKVQGLQTELLKKLDELNAEERRYITSENLHTGFDVSHVSKAKAAESSTPVTKTTDVELLNPNASAGGDISSGAEADVEDEDPDNIEATNEAKEFAKIRVGDYRTSLNFLQQHPSILTERNSDGLLMEAFNAQMDGKETLARQAVHQALLIQYCRQLGKDGVGLFFKRITTKDHQANKLFSDDAQGTYSRIKNRVAEIKKEREEQGEPAGVETIQLHAVDPNTTISIRVPPPIPTDLAAPSTDPPPTEDEIAGRRIFETFSPGLQRALEHGSLDEVNKVLAKMSVDEAEEVVAKLSEGGILSVEEGIVDTTTTEGQKMFEEINKTHQLPDEGLDVNPPPE